MAGQGKFIAAMSGVRQMDLAGREDWAVAPEEFVRAIRCAACGTTDRIGRIYLALAVRLLASPELR